MTDQTIVNDLDQAFDEHVERMAADDAYARRIAWLLYTKSSGIYIDGVPK